MKKDSDESLLSKILHSRYYFDSLISLLGAIFVVFILELLYFRNAQPNYYQRINIYFYTLLPFISGILLIAYFRRRKKHDADLLISGRSIRSYLLLTFLLISLLPSTPVFIMSSDIIQRGIEEYLAIDADSIRKLHRDSLDTVFLPKLRQAQQSEPGFTAPCSALTYLWGKCFGTLVLKTEIRSNSKETEQIFAYYKKFYRRQKENRSIDYFIYRQKTVEHVTAALHASEDPKKIYFQFLTNDQKNIFINTENILQRYRLMTTYQAPIRTAVDIFLALLLAFILLTTIGLAFLLSRRLSEPITAVALAADNFRHKGIDAARSALVEMRQHRKNEPVEIDLLTSSLLSILDELETYKNEQFRRQKYEAWQEVARRIAHEIKNPLTPMKLSAERIRRQTEKYQITQELSDVIKTGTASIIQQVEIIRKLTDSFRELATLPHGLHP